jgi:hypothetical protein
MTYKINIPKPCHEDWNKFTPAEQGKHCQVCAKTVIDFTSWEPNTIATFLITNKEEETCGRFTKTQLETAIPTAAEFAKQISYFRMPTWKKIAAIFLFAFVLQNNSFANEAIVHGGISITPMPTLDFSTNKLLYKVAKPKKKIGKPKKKISTKKKMATKKHTKRKVKVVKPVPEEIIMGKMIMPVQH